MFRADARTEIHSTRVSLKIVLDSTRSKHGSAGGSPKRERKKITCTRARFVSDQADSVRDNGDSRTITGDSTVFDMTSTWLFV